MAEATNRLADAQNRLKNLKNLFGENLLGAGAVGALGGPLGSIIAQFAALNAVRRAQAAAAQAETAVARGTNAALDEYVSLLARQVQERTEAIAQGRGTVEILNQERALFATIGDLIQNQPLSLDQINRLGSAIQSALGAINTADAKPFEEQSQRVSELVARLQLANAAQEESVGLFQRAQGELDGLNAKLTIQREQGEANLKTLQDAERLTKALNQATGQNATIGLTVNTTEFIEPLKQSVNELHQQAVSLEEPFLAAFNAAAAAARLAQAEVEQLRAIGAD